MNETVVRDNPPEQETQILRHANVRAKLGVSASTLFDMVAKGVFPKPFQIIPGGRAVGWLESEIDSWILKQREGGVASNPRKRGAK